jgi:hypothetical protein
MAAGSAVDPPKGVSEEQLDRLFKGPLEEFTPARDSLAKQLRADGKKGAADWVKALKKPTRAAWLANQLSHRRRSELGKLLDLGETLRNEYEQVLSGSADHDRLRESARREQRAIDGLVKSAESIGQEHGISSPVLDRVVETLQAASIDPKVADALRRGRLQREQRASSIGLSGAVRAAPRAGAKERAAGQAAERRERQRAKRRQAAERKMSGAEKRVERERASVERAADALEDRHGRLRDAERQLAAAQRELKELE